MLVAFEGIDACGKGTQSKLLAASDPDNTLFSFPAYSSFMGKIVYDYLHGNLGEVPAIASASLFALDRYQFRGQLLSRMDRGIVVCDRYVASNAAFQSARGKDPKLVGQIYEMEYRLLGLPIPDLNILLRIPVEVALERLKHRGRKLDAHEHEELLTRVCRVYEDLAELDARWIVLDATQTVDQISEQVLQAIAEHR